MIHKSLVTLKSVTILNPILFCFDNHVLYLSSFPYQIRVKVLCAQNVCLITGARRFAPSKMTHLVYMVLFVGSLYNSLRHICPQLIRDILAYVEYIPFIALRPPQILCIHNVLVVSLTNLCFGKPFLTQIYA